MLDVDEYMLTLREQERAVQGMAHSTREVIHCLEQGEGRDGQLLDSFMKVCGYRAAYNALIQHAEALWDM